MVGANRFTEQEQGCRAEIVIQRIPAVEGQRDLLGRRGPEIAQNAPEISYDTAAINHGPHASARAVMAQQIPHQEEAQVSLQDGVEQIDVDRQYCVEKGKIMRRRSRDSCLPVQASVIRFRKGAAR